MTAMLETIRLLLCPLEVADAEQIQAIFPHWEVVRFLVAACETLSGGLLRPFSVLISFASDGDKS